MDVFAGFNFVGYLFEKLGGTNLGVEVRCLAQVGERVLVQMLFRVSLVNGCTIPGYVPCLSPK